MNNSGYLTIFILSLLLIVSSPSVTSNLDTSEITPDVQFVNEQSVTLNHSYPINSMYSITSNATHFIMADYGYFHTIEKSGTNYQYRIAQTGSTTGYQGLVYDGEYLWFADETNIYKMYDHNFTVIETFSNPTSRLAGMTYYNQSILLLDGLTNEVIHVEASNLTETERYELDLINNDDIYTGITIIDGFIYTSTLESNNEIRKFIPSDGSMISYIDIRTVNGGTGLHLQGLDYIDNIVWLLDDDDDTLKGFDISNAADQIIIPSDDNYTVRNSDTINGLSNILAASDDGYYTIFMKFSVEQISNVSSAHLSFSNSHSEVTTATLYGVDDDTWTELTLHGNNQPEFASNVISTIDVYGVSWISWNVTDIVNTQTDGWVSFAITTSGYISSRSKDSNSVTGFPILQINGTIYGEKMPVEPLRTTETQTTTSEITTTETVTSTPATTVTYDTTVTTSNVSYITETEMTTRETVITNEHRVTSEVVVTNEEVITSEVVVTNEEVITSEVVITNAKSEVPILLLPLALSSVMLPVLLRRYRSQ